MPCSWRCSWADRGRQFLPWRWPAGAWAAALVVGIALTAQVLAAAPPEGRFEIVPLPPIDQGVAPANFTFPSILTEPLPTDTEVYIPTPERFQEYRDSFFQKVNLVTTYLPRGGSAGGVGLLDFDLSATFALPLPTPESPLLIVPGFDHWLVDGPRQPDLPPQLYDAYLQLRWLSMLTDRLGVDLSVAPGWHSDYHNGDFDDAFRLLGHGLAAWEWNPEVKLVLGAIYLDRDDLRILPAGGILWSPNDDTRVEAVFPRPRFARRFVLACDYEDWWYVGGELGGGQWAIERADGLRDVLTARDYRVLLGWERKAAVGLLSGRVEVGYVFGRLFEFRSDTPDIKPGDTAMVRAGLAY